MLNRIAITIALAALLGCGADPISSEVAGNAPKIVDTADAQINLIRTLKMTATWVITDTLTGEGTVTLVGLDGRDTVAYIQRGTLTNRHSCTAGGFGQAMFNNVEWIFEDLGIPDTSSVCIESEW